MMQNHIIKFERNHVIKSGNDCFKHVNKLKITEIEVDDLIGFDHTISNKVISRGITAAEHFFDVKGHQIRSVFILHLIKVIVDEINDHMSI